MRKLFPIPCIVFLVACGSTETDAPPAAPERPMGAEGADHHLEAPADPAETPSQDEKAKTFACPMHPEVTSHEPGSCSECGMDLVEMQHGGEMGAHDAEGSPGDRAHGDHAHD